MNAAPDSILLFRRPTDPLPRLSIREMIHGIERVIVYGTDGSAAAIRYPEFRLEPQDYCALLVVLEFLVKLSTIQKKLADLLRRERLL